MRSSGHESILAEDFGEVFRAESELILDAVNGHRDRPFHRHRDRALRHGCLFSTADIVKNLSEWMCRKE